MKIDKLPADAVLIKGSRTDYIDRLGNVYSINTNGKKRYFIKKELVNVCGYKCCGIKYYRK